MEIVGMNYNIAITIKRPIIIKIFVYCAQNPIENRKMLMPRPINWHNLQPHKSALAIMVSLWCFWL